MAHRKQSIRQTLQLIADILSFDTSDSDLENQLSEGTTDWDNVVKIASKHLMLPALYCRLEQRSLLELLPEDLVIYLRELTILNRERNQTLLQEAKHISQLFKENSIDHVFVKGIAILAGNYYTDSGERMIGDIDVLVDTKYLDKAFNLLVAEGYSEFIEFDYQVKNYRHRPRQLSKEHLGAVEVHGQLLKHGYNQLIDKNAVLNSKQMVNSIAIPSTKYLILNTVYANQINDHNFFLRSIKLKGVYDTLILKLPHKSDVISELSTTKYGQRFLEISSVFFKSLSPKPYNSPSSYDQRLFILRIRYPKFGRFYSGIKLISLNLHERIQLLFHNESYRKHLMRKVLFK